MNTRVRKFGQHFILSVIMLLIWVESLHAHDPGLSTLAVKISDQRVEAEMIFALADVETLRPLDADLDGQVSEAEFTAQLPALTQLAQSALSIGFDNQSVAPGKSEIHLDAQKNVHFQFTSPRATASQIFTVTSALLSELSRGHRQYVIVKSDHGAELSARMFSAADNSLTLELPAAAMPLPSETPGTSFFAFLSLGVRHILTGYDHLLFLFSLLLVCATFGASLKIITSFTLAHSITLAVATLNLVNFPSRIVEPLIAASIVYVGCENLLRPRATSGRCALTFAFGLVHGFGFATVLREMGVAASGHGVLVPLCAFNLGVEAGQLAIAGGALPLLWWLRQKPAFAQQCVPACSSLVMLAGGYWLIERLWF